MILALLLFACLTQEPTAVYGQPSDLKGLTKVYVDAGVDTKNRDSIIKSLEKSKLGFEVVDELKDAEILLSFGAGAVSRKVVGTRSDSIFGSSVMMQAKTQRTGEGVVVALNARGKDRLVHSFEDVQNSKWERNPVDNFCREFLKVYKEGNTLK